MEGILHRSDCALHNEPAFPKGRCDCGALEAIVKDLIEAYIENPTTLNLDGVVAHIIALVRQESLEVATSGLTDYKHN